MKATRCVAFFQFLELGLYISWKLLSGFLCAQSQSGGEASRKWPLFLPSV